jgi:hypothetical protein
MVVLVFWLWIGRANVRFLILIIVLREEAQQDYEEEGAVDLNGASNSGGAGVITARTASGMATGTSFPVAFSTVAHTAATLPRAISAALPGWRKTNW